MERKCKKRRLPYERGTPFKREQRAVSCLSATIDNGRVVVQLWLSRSYYPRHLNDKFSNTNDGLVICLFLSFLLMKKSD